MSFMVVGHYVLPVNLAGFYIKKMRDALCLPDLYELFTSSGRGAITG